MRLSSQFPLLSKITQLIKPRSMGNEHLDPDFPCIGQTFADPIVEAELIMRER